MGGRGRGTDLSGGESRICWCGRRVEREGEGGSRWDLGGEEGEGGGGGLGGGVLGFKGGGGLYTEV
jgi:hypothetical protein